MIVHSFRAKLTLWNVAVLALVVSFLVAALLHRTNAQEDLAVEQELVNRGRFFEMFSFMVPPGAPAPRPGPPSSSPPRVSQPSARRSPPQAAGRPGPSGLPPSSIPYDRTVERFNWFRSPRFIGTSGHTLGPPGTPAAWDPVAARLALSGRMSTSTSQSRGERIRVLSIPVRREGRIAGVVQVAHELGDLDRMRAEQMRVVLALTPIALLVAALGGLFLTYRALRPVAAITEAAAQIGEEDLSRRLTVRGRDELARLAGTFNQMVERLDGAFRSRAEAFAKLEQAYERQKRFTADASHELRTPLTRIKTTTSAALQQDGTPDEYRQALDVADHAADNMTNLVEQLLLLARADAGQLAPALHPVDLGDVLADVIEMAGDDGRVSLERPEHPLLVMGDEGLLLRAFANLIENAKRHTPATGSIVVSGSQDGSAVIARVADTGPGIAPEHLPRLFERFYRVESHRSRDSGGAGLGLAICRGIVQAHGGEIGIESQVGQGTQVTVSLPVATPTKA